MPDRVLRPSGISDSATSVTTGPPGKPPREPRSLVFGIERLGLVSLSFPLLVTLLTIGLSVLAGFGVARIRVDDSLSQLFRSDTPEFRQYEELSRRFPSS